MFRKWLENNTIADYSFSNRIFPPASDREFWTGITGEEQIQKGEDLLGYEWPLIRATQYMAFIKDGNRLVQEEPHLARRRALLNLFIAELSEYKGRFLSDICDGIFLICEESYWGVSAHASILRTADLIPDVSSPYIDLFASDTAALIAIIYHVLYQELKEFCPPIIERIEYELDRRIVTPYVTHGDFWWMGNICGINNWNPWIISNLLAVFLVCDLRQSIFEIGLKKMMNEINVYYRSIPNDGGCDEGSNYWMKAGAKLFVFCDLLYIATKGNINFFEDNKLRQIGLYELRAYIANDYFVNFGDGNRRIKDNMDYVLFGFGKRTNEESLCSLAGTYSRRRTEIAPRTVSIIEALFSFVYGPEIRRQSEFIPDDVYYLPDLQNSFVRAGQWYYAAKGGHNAENHNHNDVASFMIYHQGQAVLIDPGCGTYTKSTFDASNRYKIWTMQSGWHNLPVINDCEQLPGVQYHADFFRVDDKNTAISFASAYPKEAKVETALRQIAITEHGVTLSDRFIFNDDKNTVEEHFITLLKPEQTDSGVLLGGKYLLIPNVAYTMRDEYMDFDDDEKLTEAWGIKGVYRIRLCFLCNKEIDIKIEIIDVESK